MSQNELPEIGNHLNPRKNSILNNKGCKYRYRKSLINKKYNWVNQSLFVSQTSSIQQLIKINLTHNVAVFKKRNFIQTPSPTEFQQTKSNPNKKVIIFNYTPAFNIGGCQSDLRTCKSLLNAKVNRDPKKLQSIQSFKRRMKIKTDCNQKIQSIDNAFPGKRQQFELKPWKNDNDGNDKQNAEFYD